VVLKEEEEEECWIAANMDEKEGRGLRVTRGLFVSVSVAPAGKSSRAAWWEKDASGPR